MSSFISNKWTRKLETDERLQKADEMAQMVRTTLPLIKTVVTSAELKGLDQLNKLFEKTENNFQLLQQKAKDAKSDEEKHEVDLLTIRLLRDQGALCRQYYDYANQYIAKLKGVSL